MTGIERFNSPAKTQRIGNDSIYGGGQDGTVVIASNTSLTRDMYYDNLTINSGSHLNTNGFKVFVKNTLTVNGSIGIYNNASITTGTVSGTSASATNTTKAIGGSAAGSTYTASQISSQLMQDLENVILGGYTLPDGTINILSGGAGGENGVAGTVTPAANGSGAGTAPTTWPGQAGTLNRTAGYPGGPGTQGANGTNGVKGTDVPAASAGVGAGGGGVVLIIAKSIVGTGSLLSQGKNGTAGGLSATGTGATNGAIGASGNPAPSASLTHGTENHAAYQTGNGTGPYAHVSAPPLPRSGHVPAASTAMNQSYWGHTSHGATPKHAHNSHGGSNPHHGGAYQYHHASNPTASYYSQNSLDHGAGGVLGHNGAVAHYYAHTSGAIWSNYYHETDHHTDTTKDGHVYHTNANRTRYDETGVHDHGVYRQAGTSAYHATNSFAGGVGGPGGSAGTNGTNGSTTAGTNGKSGGGGGIIMVTDSAIAGTLTVSTTGGSIGGVSGSSGMQITVLNQ